MSRTSKLSVQCVPYFTVCTYMYVRCVPYSMVGIEGRGLLLAFHGGPVRTYGMFFWMSLRTNLHKNRHLPSRYQCIFWYAGSLYYPRTYPYLSTPSYLIRHAVYTCITQIYSLHSRLVPGLSWRLRRINSTYYRLVPTILGTGFLRSQTHEERISRDNKLKNRNGHCLPTPMRGIYMYVSTRNIRAR